MNYEVTLLKTGLFPGQDEEFVTKGCLLEMAEYLSIEDIFVYWNKLIIGTMIDCNVIDLNDGGSVLLGLIEIDEKLDNKEDWEFDVDIYFGIPPVVDKIMVSDNSYGYVIDYDENTIKELKERGINNE